MLKIGEFATLTGISIHMLRNYDKIGLLKPAMTDESSGYRFYGEQQLVQANYIQVLKGLGFGLQEIKDLLKDNLQEERIRSFLQSKLREKEESLTLIQKQMIQMKQALGELESDKELTISVGVKQLPARKLVSVREVLHEFYEEGLLWKRLDQACIENGIKLADVKYGIAMTHSVDMEQHQIDTEVFRVVEQEKNDIEGIRFSYMPETKAAVVAFQGVYTRIGDINRYVYHWIEENGYRMTGKSFNVYYISPGNESNPEKYVTEICYPIKDN